MIAKELEIVFNNAVQEARKRRHDMVSLEHLLHAMLSDRYSIEVLRACGVDLMLLRRELEEYLGRL